jgi:chaperonin GroES
MKMSPLSDHVLVKRAQETLPPDQIAAYLQPLDDRVLVRRLEVKKSLIVLTDEDPGQLAEVLAAGPGRMGNNGKRRPLAVKPGDVVLIPGAANQFPDWSAGERILIQEGDIAGIMEQSEAN